VENEKICKIVMHLETSVSPSFISRKSWCLPVNEKYPVQSAIQILKKMEDLGLGTVKNPNCLLKPSSMTLAMMRAYLFAFTCYFQGRF